MRVYRRHMAPKRSLLFVFATTVASITLLTLSFWWYPSVEELPPVIQQQEKPVNDPLEKIDWHDYEFMRVESERQGLGEHGKAAYLPADYDKQKYREIFEANQYNGLLSDYISVNRSVPDTRHEGCKRIKYRRHLPDASVIVPVHDEHWSTLLRTLYSIINRSPAQLLREVIIVDDGSTKEELKAQLDAYVTEHLPKVRVLRIPAPRQGLMAARSLGASNAKGEVLIFSDAHVEMNVNWLPPLLEPIAENYRACVCPVFDVIDKHTYEYIGYDGIRGAFDWELRYQRLPLLQEDLDNPTRPYKSPVMLGAVSAISARFFWELGGYDPELKIWGAEQYELSFKVWQCGGILIDPPCSKVAHMYREKSPFKDPGIGDFVGRNHRRVAEVWMDEYAQYVYMRQPGWAKLDPGNLSERRQLREKLKCKSFKWYMEEVAFDITRDYPLIEPPNYGQGRIRPIDNNQLCLTVVDKTNTELLDCNLPQDDMHRKDFLLSWRKHIKITGTWDCLDISASEQKQPKAKVSSFFCYPNVTDNQLWRYDLRSQQFVFSRHTGLCLSHGVRTRNVFAEACDPRSRQQKWLVDSLNAEALQKWNTTVPLIAY